ncbi:MAG: hypothetical protein PHT12_01485 [Patescibacteria group bacterium]|nr:hypothetical protein [Patescibacteria group bacterium]
MKHQPKPVGLKQSHTIMGVLAQNADWGSIPSEVGQAIIDDPIGSGARFTAFLRKENPWAVPTACLVQTPVQAGGGTVTLREMLDDAKRYGCLRGAYDFYRQNPDKIPADWKGKVVFFPETEFASDGSACVRFVCWDGQGWYWHYGWHNGRVDSNGFVAVPASPL